MSDDLDHIIFSHELPPRRAEELRRLIASNPELAAAFKAWLRYGGELRTTIHEATADTELFALFALYEHGDRASLSGDERRRVEGVLPAFRDLMSRHPGLASAAEDIGRAADEFAGMWDGWFGSEEPGARPSRRRRADDVRPTRPAESSRRVALRWGGRIAIVTSLVLFVVLLVVVVQRDHAMTEVATGADEVRLVELGDGSTVRLMPESELSFTPPKAAAPIGRQAVLSGRAYFDVVPSEKGLVVKTTTAQLTVLGTSFGVRADEELTEVVLARGRLAFASRHDPTRPVMVSAGHMSRVADGGSPTEPEVVAVHERLTWTGLFVFTSTPLPTILSNLQAHYAVNLSHAPRLDDELVTGEFEREQQLVEILQTIASAVGATVQPLPDGGYRLE